MYHVSSHFEGNVGGSNTGRLPSLVVNHVKPTHLGFGVLGGLWKLAAIKSTESEFTLSKPANEQMLMFMWRTWKHT